MLGGFGRGGDGRMKMTFAGITVAPIRTHHSDLQAAVHVSLRVYVHLSGLICSPYKNWLPLDRCTPHKREGGLRRGGSITQQTNQLRITYFSYELCIVE